MRCAVPAHLILTLVAILQRETRMRAVVGVVVVVATEEEGEEAPAGV